MHDSAPKCVMREFIRQYVYGNIYRSYLSIFVYMRGCNGYHLYINILSYYMTLSSNFLLSWHSHGSQWDPGVSCELRWAIHARTSEDNKAGIKQYMTDTCVIKLIAALLCSVYYTQGIVLTSQRTDIYVKEYKHRIFVCVLTNINTKCIIDS